MLIYLFLCYDLKSKFFVMVELQLGTQWTVGLFCWVSSTEIRYPAVWILGTRYLVPTIPSVGLAMRRGPYAAKLLNGAENPQLKNTNGLAVNQR